MLFKNLILLFKANLSKWRKNEINSGSLTSDIGQTGSKGDKGD